ncbi:multidrug effflux MFS transporter [Acinetobacter rathckeae]|uniref:multidrug effflux MFS transporter n=1 Tax=Acinetobacter rathckeae TaxID=2605272 RepID=UPI0018A29972|nr:multidrug effflux MFS transporter [Acinetobacter rathckeae]MBF7688786.1 multidrug effflux MFS transporter [Acinetobacter rathckeae]MBF7696263.1 multidrug effflux MFS transporter [Acinetobacter rathckeae]
MNQTDEKTPSKIALLVILSALMAFTSLSIDIYLPAMPAMQADLKGHVELTITSFLIGFSIAQLIWGPMSDRIGRKKPLFIGMVLFMIGSAGCALSQTIEQIIFWRVFQALGACTAPMLARAMVRDLYERVQAAQMLSTLMLIMAIAPILGPLIGGQILKMSSWHAIFWLLAVIGLIMFICIFRLPETHAPKIQQQDQPIKRAFLNYGLLLKNWQFMRYVLALTAFYVAAYTFIVGSPLVYISYYHIDSQHYGWLFGLNIMGVMIFSLINKRLVRRIALHKLLKWATTVSMCAMLTLVYLFYAQHLNLTHLIVFLFIFFSMNGVIAATSIAAALDTVPQVAGSASALIGSMQYGSGIISSLLLTFGKTSSPEAMIIIMAIFATMSAVVSWFPHREIG